MLYIIFVALITYCTFTNEPYNKYHSTKSTSQTGELNQLNPTKTRANILQALETAFMAKFTHVKLKLQRTGKRSGARAGKDGKCNQFSRIIPVICHT